MCNFLLTIFLSHDVYGKKYEYPLCLWQISAQLFYNIVKIAVIIKILERCILGISVLCKFSLIDTLIDKLIDW